MSIPKLPTRGLDDAQQRLRVVESINNLIDGKLRVTGTVTLAAGATSTIVEDNLFESNMVPCFTALTANAASALGGMYVSFRGQGTFTLTHANNAQTDRTFAYTRFG